MSIFFSQNGELFFFAVSGTHTVPAEDSLMGFWWKPLALKDAVEFWLIRWWRDYVNILEVYDTVGMGKAINMILVEIDTSFQNILGW